MCKLSSQFLKAALLVLSFLIPIAAYSADGYIVPRTEWGKPDLKGVWNFSSNIPMERPEHFGEREYLTEQEIAAASDPSITEEDDSLEAAPLPEGEVGKTYDDFWNEQTSISDSIRTSHIVYPKNGRVPPRQDGILLQYGTRQTERTAQRPSRHLARGIGADGPEDRGLACLLYTSPSPRDS